MTDTPFTPTQFEFTPSVKDPKRRAMDYEIITIEVRDGFDGRKWAIKQRGNCLGKDGEWELEMQPSSRTDEFKQRCRWDSFEEAALFLMTWWVTP